MIPIKANNVKLVLWIVSKINSSRSEKNDMLKLLIER